MTSYCKSNVRRVVNYTNKEPLNKYDLWLSENARYNEDGTVEFDNQGLPACDLIMKVFRNGRWEPIVGYNTTALNKINCVGNENKTQYHPALFTDLSPDELQDDGSLGEVILKHVSPQEWAAIFNSPSFYNQWNGNQSHIEYDINRAGSNTIGGIWANVFTPNPQTLTEYVESKFVTSTEGVNDKLYTYAGDIVDALNTWHTNHSSSQFITTDIPFATTSVCGGILSDKHPNFTDFQAFKPVEIKFYPDNNPVGKEHRLCASAHDIIDAINEYNLYQYQNEGQMSITGGLGIGVLAAQDVTTHEVTTAIFLKHSISDYGKYLKLKSDGSGTEWVNLPSGSTDTWRPIQVNDSSFLDNDSTGNTLNIKAGNNIRLDTSTDNGVKTITIVNTGGGSGTEYSAGTGIDITSNTISIYTAGALNGQVLTKTTNSVAWQSIPGMNIISQNVDCNSQDILVDANKIKKTDNTDIETMSSWSFYNITNFKSFNGFKNISNTGNPIYLKIEFSLIQQIVCENSSIIVIDSNNCLTGNNINAVGTYLFTLQFGVVKIERISTLTDNSNLNDEQL